ncbi:hypothetical protein AB1A65_17585 [Muricauda sp. ANG21]|uniref:tetratricopeptide repeat protein n=1 Tax=Allomuricauda sp. ANG21 TaxID=3042468 RepID=UPI0034548A38
MGFKSKNITLTVLPFENLSKNGERDIYCKSFSLDLLTGLSQFRQFEILYLNPFDVETLNPDILSGCDYHVCGAFSEHEGNLKINVQLIDSASSRIAWSHTAVNKSDLIQEIQEELLSNLVASLQHQLDTDLLTQMRRKRSTDLKAYEFWLRGVSELKKGTPKTDETAREYFNRALNIDPGFSLAYSGMSLSYFNEWSCQVWDRWDLNQKGAKKWAEKALETDSQNYIGNLIFGKVLLFERSFAHSEVYLRKALRLNPNDPFNLIQVASSFIYFNHLEEAYELYEKAIRLNPFHAEQYHPVGAYILFEQKQFQESIAIGEGYTNTSWVDYPAIMAACHYYLGNEKIALQLWQNYIDNFHLKISTGDENIQAKALKWMIDMNPYRYETAFKEFWEFIGSKKEYEFDFKLSANAGNQNLFVKEGDMWRIVFMGKSIHLPHSKGLADIATLLSIPGREMECVQLMGVGLATVSHKATDKKSLNEARKKIAALEEELQSAHEMGLHAEIEKLQADYDALIEYLSKSLDNQGRIRKIGSINNKARSAVTQRIKNAIKKIEPLHSPLFIHLSTSISTGHYCSYKPQKDPIWQT